ncbi:NAD-dependent epimerase/dehydratase family protein [Denitrobaculum tricleocarpae]|uniref:NAD-dependent epimerase/dehydratase family protein n=1 Tax=Denitrobaculum tricleocarpae TaxID=2591009 RepID=A0A545TXZ5_9PROT|nr:NAD-dependent epimerase/dehydratase family protein [Denitrobaculum tricleocarpae]TQV82077.1 NAD-dependent epimerase/dehydratase family protein [Denitrobaculum tricleocarpae]
MIGRRVFVSGGAGVIGLELVPRLVRAGATVLVGDLKPRPASFESCVIYRQGDLNALSQAELDAFAPDVFIHLAATFERSTESIEFWGENFRHNVMLSHHLMTLGRRCPTLRRVVFASSYLIYDQSLYQFDTEQKAGVCLNEEHPISPRNLTGMAKLAHETELKFLDGFEEYPFTSICVRIFRGYGRNSRDVISRWVRALIAGEPITVYRREGLFDYTYAADSAEGLLRLAQADHATGVVNLGTGRSRRVSDVVTTLQQHFPDAQVNEVESDIPFEASQADVSKLRSILNWVPAYDLEDAIQEIVDFERAQCRSQKTGSAQRLGNVLITSAARKAPLVRAMKSAAQRIGSEIEIIAGDIDPDAPTQHVADGFWPMPRTEVGELPALLSGCIARGIRAILPTRDGELTFWAENRAAFAEQGIEVIVSKSDSVACCLDKLAFAEFGIANDLPTIPASIKPEDIDADRFVVKERFGAGSRSIGLNLELDAAREHAKTLDAPIFQAYFQGLEISIDAWINRDGTPAGLVLRRRDRVVNGESQTTTTFRDPQIEAEAWRILAAFDLYGPVVMQAIVINGSTLEIIEINARFGGASTTSLAVGLDIFYWSITTAFGMAEGQIDFLRSDHEVRQIRLPSDTLIYDPDI